MNKTHPKAKLLTDRGRWWIVTVPVGLTPPDVITLRGRVFRWAQPAFGDHPVLYTECSMTSLTSESIITSGRDQ